MGGFKKPQLFVALLCLSLAAAPMFQLPEVHAEFSDEVTQLLTFFRDVLHIDTSQCTVHVSHETGDNSPELGTRGQKGGRVVLTFEEGGSVHSLFEFRGKYLTWCLVYYDVGNIDPIPYIEPPSDDPLELAHDFLQRYEQFTNDSNIGDMDDLLQEVTVVEPLSKVDGNLKLDISVRDEPDFDWSYTFEGEDYYLLGVGFFSPPHIFAFSDRRHQFTMNESVFPLYEPLNSPSFTEPSLSSPSPAASISSKSTLPAKNSVSPSSSWSALSFPAVLLAVVAGLSSLGYMHAKRLKRRALVD
jgi:hypothetical protein